MWLQMLLHHLGGRACNVGVKLLADMARETPPSQRIMLRIEHNLAYSSLTLFSFAHFFITLLIMWSTCGLFVLRSKFTTSCSLSGDSLRNIVFWNTPMAAPRLPSQNSGSGSNLSRTSKALQAK